MHNHFLPTTASVFKSSMHKKEVAGNRALFTKFSTLGLMREICNPLDDWLESSSTTNHPVGYIIRRLTRVKKLVNKPHNLR